MNNIIHEIASKIGKETFGNLLGKKFSKSVSFK